MKAGFNKNHFRERYLNFICSLQLSEDISMKTAYNLFKENLGRAEMLVYVHVFALSNSEMELDFILGQKDKEQWQVSRIGKLGNI